MMALGQTKQSKKDISKRVENLKTTKKKISQTQRIKFDVIFCTDAGYNAAYPNNYYQGKCPYLDLKISTRSLKLK